LTPPSRTQPALRFVTVQPTQRGALNSEFMNEEAAAGSPVERGRGDDVAGGGSRGGW
jgi:hypothetical protein